MAVRWEYIIIHCSATNVGQNFQAEDIDRMHRQKGWRKCGYHEVINRQGQRQNSAGGFKTRTLTEPGAHVGDCGKGWNSKALGICLIGGVDSKNKAEFNFTDEQIASLKEAVKFYQEKYGIHNENVMGHRDLIRLTGAPPKDCPCFNTQEVLYGKK